MDFSKFFHIVLVLIFSTLSSSHGAFAQSYYSDDPTLVAHYPFRWQPNDVTDNKNHGNVNGSTLTSDRFGHPNRAYDFDGNLDFIDFGSAEEFRIDGDLTISFWFNARSFEGSSLGLLTFQSDEVTNDSTSNTLYALSFENSNSMSYHHQNGSGESESLEFQNSSFELNLWHHVVVSRDIANQQIKLYVNGVLTDSVAFDLLPEGGELSTLRIGEDQSITTPDRFFEGKIDDIRIFKEVKDESKVQELFTELNWPRSERYNEFTMLLHLPLNGNANDISGFGQAGTVHGATLATDRFGSENSAYQFDGVDDKIVIPDTDLHSYMDSIGTEITISAWVYLEEQIQENPLIVQRVDDVSNNEFSLSINSSQQKAQTNINGNTNNSFEQLEPGNWYFVTSILSQPFDYQDRTLRTFVNGKHSQSTHLFGVNVNVQNGDVVIGGNNSNSRAFAGKLDDIRIYNREFSYSEVEWLYEERNWQGNTEVTLQGYYPFNGDAEDESGNGRDGISYGAELISDRFGNPNSAHTFDGEGDFIRIPFAFDYWDRTISAWIKIEDISSNRQTIFEQHSEDLETGSMGFYVENGNFTYKDGSVESEISQKISSDTWYHFAMTREDSLVKGYLNGEPVGSFLSDRVSTPTWSDTSGLSIATNRGRNNFLQGAVDDIRVYNSTLSDQEISALYSAGGWPVDSDSTAIPLEMLIAYYPFNGNAADSTHYGNHGDVHEAQSTSDRFGTPASAYSFSDSADHISINYMQTDNSVEDFSFSFLAKGVSSGTHFSTIITKSDLFPFGFAIDDGDRLYFTVRSQTDSLDLVVNSLDTDPDQWYHYAAVFSDEGLQIYRDGEQIGSFEGSISNFSFGSEISTIIGASGINIEGENASYFHGSIDELRFYNGGLSANQVFKIYQKDVSESVNSEPVKLIPSDYKLHQNYPNPFNPSTNIRFELPQTERVTLKVYDITGRLVKTLVNGVQNAGTHQVIFNASNLASGIYLYELRTNSFQKIQKLTLIK